MLEARCPIHGTVLQQGTVPIVSRKDITWRNSPLPGQSIEEAEERAKLYAADKWPYAVRAVLGDVSGGTQVVLYCQTCRDALAKRMESFEERSNSTQEALAALKRRLSASDDSS